MTVSQLFFNLKITDAAINYEIYKRMMENENKKGALANPNNIVGPRYDTENEGFKTLINAMALSTKSFFGYSPDGEIVRAAVAKKKGLDANKLPKEIKKSEPLDHLYHEYQTVI